MCTTLELQAKHSQSQCSVRALIGVHLHHSVLWISWQHWQLLNGKQLVRKYIFKIFERVTLHPSGVARPALPVPVSSYTWDRLGTVQLQWKNSLDYNGLTHNSTVTCGSLDLCISSFKYDGALKRSNKLICSFVPHDILPSTFRQYKSTVTWRLVTQYNGESRSAMDMMPTDTNS